MGHQSRGRVQPVALRPDSPVEAARPLAGQPDCRSRILVRHRKTAEGVEHAAKGSQRRPGGDAEVKPLWLCWVFAIATVAFGVLANTGIGAGSDSYGYVSQADLWLKGDLRIEQPDARKVPWPNSQWTMAPLGYRPSADRNAIVPVYAPGLPMMFAVTKQLAGQCAIRWVVPLSGGLLVLATFGIGRRMLSDQIGAGASWLVLTSPAVLTMLGQPMSDIPVASCWAVATYGCLSASLSGAALAGASAALAILIRPNLVHLGLVMGIWLIAKDKSWRRAA